MYVGGSVVALAGYMYSVVSLARWSVVAGHYIERLEVSLSQRYVRVRIELEPAGGSHFVGCMYEGCPTSLSVCYQTLNSGVVATTGGSGEAETDAQQ